MGKSENLDQPAGPAMRMDKDDIDHDDRNFQPQTYSGLTKRELACILLRIPESGDKALDDMITKSRLDMIATLHPELAQLSELIPDYKFTPALNKIEEACVALRVPKSGDEVLDKIIREGRRQEMATKITAGIATTAGITAPKQNSNVPSEYADRGIEIADAIIRKVG